MQIKIPSKQRIQILHSKDIFTIMQKILLRENKIGRTIKHFWIVGLDDKNRILFIELISLGPINKELIEPLEVFSFALQKRANKLMLVHNHPTGELTPCEGDIDFTDRLLQNSIFLEIPIIDHLIISEKKYFSFADSGLLDKLRQSKKYVVPYKEEEERLRNEGKLSKAVEVARQMLQKQFELSVISDISGLSKEEIMEI